MSYGFHPAAEAEHFESVAFFESKRPGLGASYLGEFERIMRTVCEAPHRYPIKKTTGCQAHPNEAVPVCGIVSRSVGQCSSAAVAHSRRRPQYWLGRL
jgi:hypothetical protein